MLGKLLKPVRKRWGKDRHYYRIIDTIFGIYPNNIELYKLALIHRSASLFIEDRTPVNNERLEFLGDAVLESIVSEYLFISFPDRDEGFLTQMRSRIVSRQTLNELCDRIGLSPHIISRAGGGVVQKHLRGDALEAMIGAIYLDRGYDKVSRVVIDNVLGRHLDLLEMSFTETDFKSRLIEWCQRSKHTIVFKTDFGPESTAQAPSFRSVAIIDDMELGFGMGSSKKEAEQRASYEVSRALADDIGDSLLERIDRNMLQDER